MENPYSHELPSNDVDYPAHADSADMYLQYEAHAKSMGELKARLIKQIQQRGYTNCGLTSIEQVNRTFSND